MERMRKSALIMREDEHVSIHSYPVVVVFF